MPHLTAPRTALLLAALSLSIAPGCVRSWSAADKGRPPAVSPDDFVADTRPDRALEEPPPVTLVATDADSDSTAADNPTRSIPDAEPEALAINAMVGHINGEAVYADQIFDVNIAAQLSAFGKRYDDEQFLEQAAAVIQERLRGVIINKLILGEAERNLKQAQRYGIDAKVQSEREELIRFYGQGSPSKAKAEFRKARDKDLDQHLVDYREELSIGFYIRSKVLPKINVTQRHVRTYYNDNLDKYHQPDKRVIRMIMAQSDANAQAIAARLKRGESFKKIAADPALNSYNSDNAGIFSNGEPLVGAFGIEPVNDELLKLAEGEHAGPILAGKHHYFIELVEFVPGVKIPLEDAQLQIEETLRAIQFEKYALRFRMDLLERGSYTDPAEMGEKLLEIAYARYDQ